MSSNIIVLFPNKLVAPSKKVEIVSGNMDATKAPVVTTRQTDYDDKNEGIIPSNITSRVTLQDQSAGLILTRSGLKKIYVHVNRISIQNFMK